jgi:hypothetical protein
LVHGDGKVGKISFSKKAPKVNALTASQTLLRKRATDRAQARSIAAGAVTFSLMKK